MRIIVFIVFCLIIKSSFSQNYSIKNFSKKEGLSDPFVYSILQDKEGYLFIATGKELQKFDGQFFKKVNSKKAEDELIFAGTVTQGNQLWFGTFDGNLYYYSKEQNALRHFSQNIKGSVSKILPLKNSIGFCVFSKGNGVYVTNGKYLFRINETENLAINTIEVISEDLIIAACDDGLYSLNIKTNEVTKFSGFEQEVKSIQKSSDETLILFSAGYGIQEIRIHSKDSVELVKQLVSPNDKMIKDVSSFFYVKKSSDLFISTSDEKLWIYNLLKGSMTNIPEEEFSSSVNGFYLDKEQNIWIATPGKGLYRVIRTDYEYIGSGNQSVYAITQDNSGNTYLGLNDGLLIKDKYDQIIEKKSKIGSATLGKITSLYFDSDFLWIGTESKGLFLIHTVSKKVQELEFSLEKNISVNSITGKGNKVVVTTNLDGVYIYDDRVLKQHFSVKNGLVHNNVYFALQSKKDLIFYATHNTTFNYSQENELFEIDVKEGGLNSDFNSFAEDANGNIFIATNGDGIYLFNGKSITLFNCNDKLESMYCHGVLTDKNNDLWIMQLDNLYKCNTKKQLLKKQSFNFKGTLHFNPNACYQNEKGDVFFGTDRNALLFKYDTVLDKLPKPYLSSVFINDSLYSSSNELSLPYNIYDIEFEISALCLKNSEAVTFSYILEGRDNNWSEPSAQRRLSYSKLSEGEYYLKVRAYNSQGYTTEEPFSFHFKIASPYWKKPFFWIIISISLAFMIYFVIQLRTRKLRLDKLRLEELVDEKTKQLRDEKEVVIQSQRVIQEQNEEIRDSITYARRIQDALLTESELIKKYQDRLFILYQPRDIVSGDFYWMSEIGDLKIIVAADCTGHGVPGALMSMIGSTLLNKLIVERKITRPKEILEQLDAEVKISLKQHTDLATRDGMDICLVCIDEKNGILTYAGAMRPLYHLRNKEIIEYAPTKHAIGGYSYGKVKEFSETVIKLRKNDIFYLFSDGYADQFGGEKGKKLMLKNFRTLLVSISHLTLTEQQVHLAKYYNNWKGEAAQIDDVLVIGLKI